MSKAGIVGAVALAIAMALGGGLMIGSTAEAHGGGLNRCGCHHDRRTGSCHCHQPRGCGCECQPDHCG